MQLTIRKQSEVEGPVSDFKQLMAWRLESKLLLFYQRLIFAYVDLFKSGMSAARSLTFVSAFVCVRNTAS